MDLNFPSSGQGYLRTLQRETETDRHREREREGERGTERERVLGS